MVNMELTTLTQVEERIGKSPAPRDLKVIDYIDEHAQRWLFYSHFAFMAFGQLNKIQLSAAGGNEGFVSVLDANHLQLPLSRVDEPSIIEQDLSFGALFMISGMAETLRVNGKVLRIENDLLTLYVEECFLHCAKAFRRSHFWLPKISIQSTDNISTFLKQSSFLVLASINNNGQIDVSPKGDPEGCLLQELNEFICFADRPGNRRIDSFRNIIDQPHISMMALIPGCQNILALHGMTTLCTDQGLLEKFIVQNKIPKLITKITAETKTLKPSMAITRSALWPAKEARSDINPAEIFKSHIKHSKEHSLKAKVARAAVALPGAFEVGLKADYKNNMY